MLDHASGEASILSQDDADAITHAIVQLTETVWEILARRRILLRPPGGDLPARTSLPQPLQSPILDELF